MPAPIEVSLYRTLLRCLRWCPNLYNLTDAWVVLELVADWVVLNTKTSQKVLRFRTLHITCWNSIFATERGSVSQQSPSTCSANNQMFFFRPLSSTKKKWTLRKFKKKNSSAHAQSHELIVSFWIRWLPHGGSFVKSLGERRWLKRNLGNSRVAVDTELFVFFLFSFLLTMSYVSDVAGKVETLWAWEATSRKRKASKRLRSVEHTQNTHRDQPHRAG